jgi:hypothetical protein
MRQQLDSRDCLNSKPSRPLRRRSLAAVALLTAACAADVGPESASDSQLEDETKAAEQTLTSYVQTLFQDTFTRSNGSTLGNGWSELEASNALVRIYGGKLHFYDTSDVTNRPMAQHTFPWVAHGELVWEFDADWRRTGTDSDYTVFMQLGEGSKLSSNDQNTGVGINLVWAKIGTSQQKLGYRNNGVTTALATMSTAAHIKVTANLDTKTYGVAMNGTTVGSGLPFDADTLTRLDTIRLFTTKLNETSFAGRTFDNVSLKLNNGARFSTLVGVDQRVCQELASELGAQCENQSALAARVAALFEANNHIYNDPGVFGQGIYFNPDSIYSFVGDADAERWADFTGFDVKVVFTVADPVSNCVWWENKVLMNGRTAELVLTDQFVLAHELAHTLRMYDYHTNRHWQYQPPQTMMVGGVVPFPYWEPNSKYVIDAYIRSADRPNFPWGLLTAAYVPDQVTVVVHDANGAPTANRPLSIYGAPDGGDSLWDPVFTGTTNARGEFVLPVDPYADPANPNGIRYDFLMAHLRVQTPSGPAVGQTAMPVADAQLSVFENRSYVVNVVTAPQKLGDVTGNGVVDPVDAQVLASYVGGTGRYKPYYPDMGDADCNGILEVADAQKIAEAYTFGLTLSCP